MKAKIEVATNPGAMRGKITLQKALRREQPSVRAASSISTGTEATKPRSVQMGMGREAKGTIWATSRATSMVPRPRKLKRAPARDAKSEMAIEKATTTRATTALRNSEVRKLGWRTVGPAPFTVNSSWKLTSA